MIGHSTSGLTADDSSIRLLDTSMGTIGETRAEFLAERLNWLAGLGFIRCAEDERPDGVLEVTQPLTRHGDRTYTMRGQ